MPDDLKEQVSRVLAGQVGPALGMDGLQLEVIDVTDGVARVRVRGSCGCAPSSIMAVLMGVEQELHRQVPEVDYLELAP